MIPLSESLSLPLTFGFPSLDFDLDELLDNLRLLEGPCVLVRTGYNTTTQTYMSCLRCPLGSWFAHNFQNL